MSSINLKGIALIEKFLDSIEDDDDFLESFQKNFNEIFEKQEGSLASSPAFLANKVKSDSYTSSVDPPVKAGKNISDGFENCVFKGALDDKSQPCGEGTLIYSMTESFMGTFDGSIRNRSGVRLFSGGDIAKIEGTWKNGFLEGYVRIEYSTGGFTEGFYHLGVRHGYTREYGIGGYLKEFSCYAEGVRCGWVYKGMLGGGYLIGQVDSHGQLSGDNIAYVYPDFRTAILGQFMEEELVSGVEVRVVSSVTTAGGMVVPVYSDPVNPDMTFSYDPASHLSISSEPLLRDPWEESLVEVRLSQLDQAGEGLFAKEDLPAKTVIALFAGVKLQSATVAARERPASDYRIKMTVDTDLDIPDSCTQLSSYRATLGHKANHSFTPNGNFDLFEHPRFGLIRAISSLQDIRAGEEITVNYYLGLHQGPEWYKQLWLKHVRQDKKWGDKEIQTFLDRNYDMTMKKIELPAEAELHVPAPVGATNLEDEAKYI